MKIFAVRSGLPFAALLFGLTLLPSTGADAAKIEYVKRTYCNVLFNGPIEKGDLNRLKKAFEDMPDAYSENPLTGNASNVCLNSPGGDLAEALDIVRFLAESIRYGTVVDQGEECFEVCAFVFMSGSFDYYHGTAMPSRRLHVLGKLGFRAPSNRADAGTYDRVAVQQAYTNASSAISSLIEIETSRKLKSDRNRIMPRLLMLEVLGREPEEPLMPDTVEQAWAWNVTLIGFVQPKVLTERMLLRACTNDLASSYSTRISDEGASDNAVELQNNRATRVFKNLGPRKDFDCTVQIIRDPRRGLFVNVNNNKRGKDPYVTPFDLFLEETRQEASELNRVGIGVGVPLWSLLPPETKLSALQ